MAADSRFRRLWSVLYPADPEDLDCCTQPRRSGWPGWLARLLRAEEGAGMGRLGLPL